MVRVSSLLPIAPSVVSIYTWDFFSESPDRRNLAYRFRKRKVAAFMDTYSSDSESHLDSDFACGNRSKRKSLGGGLLNAEYQRDYRQQKKAKKIVRSNC